MKTERDEIRRMLYQNCLTNNWLVCRLSEAGLKTNKCEFSAVLSGALRGAKVESIIQKSLAILKNYEDKFANT